MKQKSKTNCFKLSLYKIPFLEAFHKKYFLVFVLWLSFCFLPLSNGSEILKWKLDTASETCDVLMSWKMPVCVATDEERTLKSHMLHAQLEASLLRKKILPKTVTKAGSAVFNVGFQNTYRQWDWHFQGGSGFFMFDTHTFFTAYHVLKFILDNTSHWSEVVFKDQNGNQKEFKIKGVKFAF